MVVGLSEDSLSQAIGRSQPFLLILNRGCIMYARPFKRQSRMADKFDQIGSRKVKAVHDFRHNQLRESLMASTQFNCEGCG